VEVLLAVFLVAICAVLLAATMPMANMGRARADMLNKATSLAQRHLEAIRGLGYANITPSQLFARRLIDNTSGSGSNNNVYQITNTIRNDNIDQDTGRRILQQMNAVVTLWDFSQSNDPDIRDRRIVEVLIQYTDPINNSRQSVRLSTVVANL
jgi:type II secretory pathway pseudopilin PulG